MDENERITFLEFPGTDIDAAKNFFSSVFVWTDAGN